MFTANNFFLYVFDVCTGLSSAKTIVWLSVSLFLVVSLLFVSISIHSGDLVFVN